MNSERHFDDVKVVTPEKVQQKDGLEELVAGGATVTKQGTQYVTAVAVQRPRQLKIVKDKVISEVELEPEAAYYAWKVNTKGGGKKRIEGGTIGLAMSIARNFGNCAVDITIDETPTHYYFKPVFLDLETGFTFCRTFRQRKSQGIGMKDEDRAQDITFQIGQSKAIRNVVFSAVPPALKNTAIKEAQRLIVEDIDQCGIEKSREKCLKTFASIDVTKEQLFEYTGINDPAKWSSAVLADLRTAFKTIDTNQASVKELFPEIEKPKPAETDTYTPPVEPEKKDPDDKSAMTTSKQSGAIYSKCTSEYKLDKVQALTLVSAIADHPVGSMKDLTKDEATHVIDVLEHPDTTKGYLTEISREKKDLFDK